MSYNQHTASSSTMGGTFGGILLVMFNLHIHDLTKTAILAAAGAVVSFCVSLSMNLVVKWVNAKWKAARTSEPGGAESVTG
jgi:hypothetical protein